MIRKMQNPDINRVADIWLKTNLKAHDFIPEQYWTSTSQFNHQGDDLDKLHSKIQNDWTGSHLLQVKSA